MVMKYLLAVGACYLDTILTVENYPAEDEKLRASSIIRRRGGNCPNTLEVLQQLLDPSEQDPNEQDSPSLVLCAVFPSSSSIATQEIRSSFGPTVDLTRCVYREDCIEPASSYVIRSRSTGSRTLINFNELPEMTTQEFVALANELGNETSWCHFEGRIPDIILECMQYIRQRFPAVRISVEIEKPARSGLQSLAAEANVVFYSKSWAQGNGYETAEDCLRAQAALAPNASLLCCTWGHDGASALELPAFVYKQSPAFVDEKLQIIDTIGAGDTFISGMLYGLTCHSNDWNLSQKLSFANELAGRKVLQEGFTGLRSIMQHRL